MPAPTRSDRRLSPRILAVGLMVTAAPLALVSTYAPPSDASVSSHPRHDSAAVPAATTQRVGIPAYFDPTSASGMADWNRLISTAPAGTVAILDVDNLGPGPVKVPQYADVARRARAAGIKVFGYVETKVHPTPTTSRVRPLSDMVTDVNNNFAWYNVDGIFFDEAHDFCADAGPDPYSSQPGTVPLQYLKDLYAHVKSVKSDAVVAMNPGANSFECMMQVADVLANQETDGTNYLRWKPPAWVSKRDANGQRVYPDSRFWSLVYNVRGVSAMQAVVRHSRTAHAGYVYVTDNGNSSTNPDLSNPWFNLPRSTYWSAELRAVQAPLRTR